jgi:hypothetical protein
MQVGEDCWFAHRAHNLRSLECYGATSMVPVVCEADDLILLVAVGAGGKSMWYPTAGDQSLAVSKAIDTGPS